MKNIIQGLFIVMFVSLWNPGSAQHTVEFPVGGACGMCKTRIENTAESVKGVKDAYFDLSSKTLELTYKDKDFDVLKVHSVLAEAGHDTDQVRATDEDYSKLEDCCQYRDFGFSPHASIIESRLKKQSLPEIITGQILEEDTNGDVIPVIGANVLWEGAPFGTVTDVDGRFELGRIKRTNMLVVSYVGYDNDTIDLSQRSDLKWMMSGDVILSTVEVTHRAKTSEISFLNPIQTFNVSEDELCKAACCNLSESFETSPAIDVSFTDAVTGTRQIQMLGLAGKYVQITRELIPDIRGLASIYGLTYTPGAWVESLQLSKGAGSVVNGHESMTGQINVELRKPQKKEWFYLNLYGNEGGRYEGNLTLKHKLNENLSTAVLMHGSSRDRRHDRNDDGFMDMPIGRDFLAINRWKYQNESGLQGQFGYKISTLQRTSGQTRYDHELDHHSKTIWGSQNETLRHEAWMKIGKVFSELKNQSIGFQLSGAYHEQDLIFGLRDYISDQNNVFANLIFQSDLGSPDHTIRAGATFNWDLIDENFDGVQYDRDEKITGAYGEYTLKSGDQFTAVAGLRADHHNQYGLMWTPRLHLRNAFSESTVVRLVAGKGWRTANIFAENLGMLATGRQVRIIGSETANPYGLNPEIAWNFGANLTQTLDLGRREATLSLDYYYTTFEDQIVADFESDATGTVILANQSEMTEGHSVQAQLDAELLPRFDLRAAYRYNYSEVDFGGESKSLTFTPFHRAFANLAYETENKWFFDVTVNWRGEQRIPNTDWLDIEDRLAEYSDDYWTVNAQVRKIFDDRFELYVGVENLLDYTQENPIINADDPFSSQFDASLIWAPIFGRNVYSGLRYRIE